MSLYKGFSPIISAITSTITLSIILAVFFFSGTMVSAKPFPTDVGIPSVVRAIEVYQQAKKRSPTLDAAGPLQQPSGNYRALVLLVDFDPNCCGPIGQTKPNFYRDLLFSWDTYPTGSMRDYFYEVSYKQLNVNGDINRTGTTPGQICIDPNCSNFNLCCTHSSPCPCSSCCDPHYYDLDDTTCCTIDPNCLALECFVPNWIRMPYCYKFYCGDQYGWGAYADPNDPAFDPNITPGNSQNLAKDAVIAADADVDYSCYDNDHDGVADSIIIVYAGPEILDPKTIWPHKWQLNEPIFLDGVWISPYAVVSEYEEQPYDSTIGVFCHEYAHILGLTDLNDWDMYPDHYIPAGIGSWGLMANGMYNGDPPGSCPAHPCAWSKKKLEWVYPINILGNWTGENAAQIPPVELMPDAANNGYIYRLWTKGMVGLEYFLVENRQKINFDASLPGAGLLIYHVDESRLYEDNPAIYLVDVEQADGRFDLNYGINYGDPNDPWPGKLGKITFDKDSIPSSRNKYYEDTLVAIKNIRYEDPNDTNMPIIADLYIEYYEPPEIDFFGTPRSGIIPLEVNFIVHSTGGEITNCNWTFGDGNSMSVEDPNQCLTMDYIYNKEGKFNVTFTATGPGGTDTKSDPNYITAYAPPIIDFSGEPTEGEVPLNVNFSASNAGGEVITWLWNFGDGGDPSNQEDPNHEYTTAGIYTVSLTATGKVGAPVTEIKPNYITVNAPSKPEINFYGDPTIGIIDPNNPVNVCFTAIIIEGEVTNWDWDFGDGNTSTLQDPNHEYINAGKYTVSLTATGPGGEDTEIKSNYITIYGPPEVDFSGTPRSGVAPLNISFTATNTGGEAKTWFWDFGDGASSDEKDPNHVYTKKGIYTVILTATGIGGSDTKTETDYITVYTPPEIDFTGTPRTGATPLEVDFTATNTGGEATSWFWNFGDGHSSVQQNPTYEYTNEGSYSVRLTATGPGGTDIETKGNYTRVYEAPKIYFFGTPKSGASPLEVSFTAGNTGGEISDWFWSFGDGVTSSLENPDHTYTKPGVYDVELTAVGPGGIDIESIDNYITVYTPPIIDFSGIPTKGTVSFKVSFLAQNTGGDIDNWLWDFGDGETSSQLSPQHTYSKSGTYSVTLTTTGPGGSDIETKSNYITAYDPPVADAGPDQTVEQTSEEGALVQLDGSKSYDTNGLTLTYKWTWDNKSATGINPQVILPVGTTKVTLKVDNGFYLDSDSVVINVIGEPPPPIYKAPVADAGPDQTVSQTSDAGAIVQLDGSKSYDPNGLPLTYTWTWGTQSATGITPEVILPIGATSITLTVDNGYFTSTDTVVITVEDTEKPVITNLTASPDIVSSTNSYQMVDVVLTCDVAYKGPIAPTCRITEVYVDYPDESNTWFSQWFSSEYIITGDMSLKINSKCKFRSLDDKIFTITVKCTDALGNSDTETTTVTVTKGIVSENKWFRRIRRNPARR